MHREISSIERPFAQDSRTGLYLFTALLGLLMGLDLWPAVAAWLGPALGVDLPVPRLPSRLFGLEMSFTLIAAVLGGVRVALTSLESLLAGRLGADLALALAVMAAIGIRQPLVAAEVVLIGLVGECLEAYTFGHTQRAIRRLVETCPRMCLVLRDGQEVKIRVDEVRPGERVVVRPGKRV